MPNNCAHSVIRLSNDLILSAVLAVCVPVVLSNCCEQLSAGAWVKTTDTTHGLLDLSHLDFILQINSLCQLHFQKAHNLIVYADTERKNKMEARHKNKMMTFELQG